MNTNLPASGRRLAVCRMLIVAAAAAALAVPAAFAGAGGEHAELRRMLSQRMPGVRIGDIRPLPFGGLYEVVANGLNVFYTNARGDVALMGEMIELGSGRNLTRERLARLHTVDFDQLPLDKAIVKVKGDGSRRMALFSDPDCPFCRQLEHELAAVTDVTIYTFLLPLPSLHPDATRKAQKVWCAPDRARAWDELMLAGREPPDAATCETPLRDIAALADRLNISGTPGIVFGSGRLVPGALGRAELEQQLNVKRPTN